MREAFAAYCAAPANKGKLVCVQSALVKSVSAVPTAAAKQLAGASRGLSGGKPGGKRLGGTRLGGKPKPAPAAA